MDLNQMLNQVQNETQNQIQNTTGQIGTGLTGGVGNVVNGLIGGIQNEALKAFLEKYWPIIVTGGVGAIILVIAAPLAGTYAESQLVKRIIGIGMDEAKKKEKNSIIDPPAKPEKPEKPENWIKLRIKDPEDFKKESFRTKIINDNIHLITAIPKGSGKPIAQSMRFKGIDTFNESKPGIEEKYKAKIYEKEPGEYGLKGQKEPPKNKKLKLPKTNVFNQKPEKKPEKQEKPKAKGIKDVLKNFNTDLKPGDKVTYKLQGKKSKGNIIKRSENKMSFEIKDIDGNIVKVPTTLVTEV